MWTDQDRRLLRVKTLQTLRRFSRLNLDSFVQASGFFLLLAVFWFLCFYVVSRLYRNVFALEIIGPLILKRIISIGFFSAFIIVAGSHVLSALSSLFRAHELSKLVSSPYPLHRLYRIQCLETLVHGGWVLGLFCVPFLVAYGIELHAGWWYYPLVLFGLLGFLVIAGNLGILIMLFIARWIMCRPLRTAFSIVFFLGAFLSTFLYVAIINRELTQDISPTRLGELLANMKVSSLPYLPSQWMSELMTSAQTLDLFRSGLFLVLLLLTAAMLWHLVLELGERWYPDAWLWAQEHIGVFQRRLTHRYRPKPLWLMRFLPRRIGGIVYKEVHIFMRDFSQWGQLVLILSLILFYVAHTQNSIYSETATRVRNLLAFFNVILLGFVQATLSLRYTYPSISLEGRAFWVVAKAENGLTRSYFTKYYLHTLVLLVIGQGMGYVLNRIVGVDPTLNQISLFILFLFAFGFTGWTLGFGAVFHKFEATNTAEVTSDSGTLITMILTLLYFGISVSFLAGFALIHTPGANLSELLALNQEQGMIVYATLFLFLQTCSILFPTAYGFKKLKEAVL